MGLLKENFQPTDFADSDCRVTHWNDFEGYGGINGYRIWVCCCGRGYWFQRHEWSKEGLNSTIMDEWIFSGFSPYRRWDSHFMPAPRDDL